MIFEQIDLKINFWVFKSCTFLSMRLVNFWKIKWLNRLILLWLIHRPKYRSFAHSKSGLISLLFPIFFVRLKCGKLSAVSKKKLHFYIKFCLCRRLENVNVVIIATIYIPEKNNQNVFLFFVLLLYKIHTNT